MKQFSRQEAIYKIALAGVSAAVALIFVTLGVFVRFSTIAFYVAAGIALMVPMSKKYYLSALFAYAVSSALGFVIAGDIVTVVGYVAYFGPVALLTGLLCNLRLKWYLQLPIKLVYINGAIALMYFVCHTIVINPDLIGEVPYWLIAVVGSVILLLIDVVEQFLYIKLTPIVARFLRPKNADAERQKQDAEEDEDPYEEELYTFVENGRRADDDTPEAENDEETDVSAEAQNGGNGEEPFGEDGKGEDENTTE